jgi:hypothetical protein
VTRVLIWKEVREQGTVLAALIVLGAAVLVASAMLLDSSDGRGATELRSLTTAGRLALLMLTITAGMVVGGTLLAGEREAGTFSFLDRLPGSRWRVWWRKAVAGAALVAAAVGAFLAVAAGGGIIDLRSGATGWVLFIGSVGFAAYGWGLLGSVFARTSLAACGKGLAAATLTGFVAYLAAAVALATVRQHFGLWWYIPGEHTVWDLAYLIASYTLMAVPIPIAAWLYTAPDRSRRSAELDVRLPGMRGVVRAGLRGVPHGRWGSGFRRLIWLTLRQSRPTALALAGTALAAGCVLLLGEAVPTAIWPALGLVVGVLAGVVGLADEQTDGASRFWGERRLPVGRLWDVKVLTGLGLTLLLTTALLIPAVAAALVRETQGLEQTLPVAVLRTGFAEPGFPLLMYLLVWPIYGFAFGHLAGLLFRKAVVAGAVGLLVGGTLAALWLPSLLSGGVHIWQVFAAPAVALLTARLLTWPWATDRLGTRRPLTRLAAGAAGVLTVTAGGIAYRVIEVPVVPDVEEDLAFAAQLPSFDERQAGRDLRRAVGLFNEIPLAVRTAGPDGPAAGEDPWKPRPITVDPLLRRYSIQLSSVLQNGWPGDRPDLARWLDQMSATEWDRVVEQAAAKPTGVLEDPAEFAPDSVFRHLDGVREMTPVYLARALRRHAEGDPAAVPEAAAVWLAVVRTTRRDTLAVPTLASRGMELQVYQMLDRWLERLDGRPDLLCEALATVQAHERLDPFDPQAVQFAHQVVARNAVLAPSRWLPNYFDDVRLGRRDPSGIASPQAETEANLVGFAWAVPWEKERLRRAVGLGNRPGRRAEQDRVLRGAPGWSWMISDDWAFSPDFQNGHKHIVAARRAVMLKVAVRMYEAETGAMPETLDALVPAYLPDVPADPFDNQPFRYRVSKGETIAMYRQRDAAPEPPPGFMSFTTVHDIMALAGVAGGAVCWPLEPGWMRAYRPSRPVSDLLSEDETTAVAGVAGGAIFCPDSLNWFIPPPEPAMAGMPGYPTPPIPWDLRWNPGMAAIAPTYEDVVIPTGQGIVWSVGPDGVDSGGVVALDPRNPGRKAAGDLVYPIPQSARVLEK